MAYPISVAFDPPEEIARWRPLVAWLLVIPQLIVVSVIGWIAALAMVVAWVVTLATGRLPDSIAGYLSLAIRSQCRVSIYAMFLKEEYPPFSFDTTAADPGDDRRVRVDVRPALADRKRLTVLFRGILVLPHAVVLSLLYLVVSIVVFLALFVVLFTGHWHTGMRDFLVGFLRWHTRVIGYCYLLTDDYPPFSFD